MDKPVVAIIGRPNVGKSTLFNRIIRERRAVVDEAPGVTRDRNYAETEWNGSSFMIVDTGGYVPSPGDSIEAAVRTQADFAMEDADLIVFLVDTLTGITDLDEDLAGILQKSSAKYILVANKTDTEREEPDVSNFYRLGLGDPIPVSALTGRYSGDLLDEIVSRLPSIEPEEEEDIPKISVVGRTNVGKSTFVNMVVGREVVITDPKPGTTRDSIDTRVNQNGREYVLIDTAGLRKRSKIKDEIEFYSSLRTERSLQRCDVALVLIDALEGPALQDSKIISTAEELGKGTALVVNKWDLVEKDNDTYNRFVKEIRQKLHFAGHIPLIFTSALDGQRVKKALDLAFEIYENRRLRISTPKLNKFLQELMLHTPPPARRGKNTRLFYCTQQRIEPPTFVFFSKYPDDVLEEYSRFLVRKLRESYGFEGVPIKIHIRKK